MVGSGIRVALEAPVIIHSTEKGKSISKVLLEAEHNLFDNKTDIKIQH